MEILSTLFFLLIYLIGYSRAVTINAIGYTYQYSAEKFNKYADGFNNYAKMNNLDITLNINLLTNMNTTYSLDNMGSMIENLLKRQTDKYDIFFYDIAYTKRYGQYLLDLEEILPSKIIDEFDKSIISQTSYYDNTIVGLPISLTYNGFFSNKYLLKKYNLEPPKTWNDLIVTSKYILDFEEDPELIGYNGLFFDVETGICSIYEFLYSCRESIDSPFPDITSQTTINAMELLKRVKNEASSDEIFKSDMGLSFEKIMSGKALYAKFYIQSNLLGDDSPYTLSTLPGLKSGISGTILGGYNIGVRKAVDKSKLNQITEVIKYMVSKDTQKQLVSKNLIISAIKSIYDDPEVCSIIKYCDFYKNSQPITKPSDKSNDLSNYSEKFTSYFYDYLYGEVSAEDTVKKLNNISKIYYISSSTSFGLIILISLIIVSVLLVSSSLSAFDNNYKKYFTFLPMPFWITLILGLVLVLSTGYTKLGMTTSTKCHANSILLSLGYTFVYIPIFCRIVESYPDDTKFLVNWIKNNKYLLFAICVVVDIFLNGLGLILPYEIKQVNNYKGENYLLCEKQNALLGIVVYLSICYKVLILLVMMFLIFIEWSNKRIYYELRFTMISIYVNFITFLLIFLFDIFRKNNYNLYFTFQIIIIFFVTIINYFLLFAFRFIFKPNNESKYIDGNSDSEAIKNNKVDDV